MPFTVKTASVEIEYRGAQRFQRVVAPRGPVYAIGQFGPGQHGPDPLRIHLPGRSHVLKQCATPQTFIHRPKRPRDRGLPDGIKSRAVHMQQVIGVP